MTDFRQINRESFLEHKPVRLGANTNLKGQWVKFYEDPLRGSDAPIVVIIAGYCAVTTFYDLDDFRPDSDYMPVLTSDGIICCQFEDA